MKASQINVLLLVALAASTAAVVCHKPTKSAEANSKPSVHVDVTERFISPYEGNSGATEVVIATFTMNVSPVNVDVGQPQDKDADVHASVNGKIIPVDNIHVTTVPEGIIRDGTTVVVTVTCNLLNDAIPASGKVMFVLEKINWFGGTTSFHGPAEVTTGTAPFSKTGTKTASR